MNPFKKALGKRLRNKSRNKNASKMKRGNSIGTMSADRAALMRLNRALRKKGQDPKKIVRTPSYLRVENTLLNAQSRYKFDIKSTSSTSVVERKLDINDSFYMTHLGLFIYQYLNTEPRNQVLQTYANQTHFTGGTNFDANDLNIIYNGSFEIKVGNTVLMEAMDTKRFQQIPETQQASATTYSQTELDQGFVEMTPEFFISGKANNEFALSTPAEGTINFEQDAANTSTIVVMYARGFLVKDINLQG